MSKMGNEFKWRDYVKGKVISYAISFLTMGISAAASSAKILQKANQVIKSLANLLRKCPYLLKIADKFDKYAHVLQVIIGGLMHVGQRTIQSVAFTVISEKIVTKALNEVMVNLKPGLKKKCDEKIRQKIDVDALKSLPIAKISEIFIQLSSETNFQSLTDVSKEISLGAARHSSNWKLKLTSLAIDGLLTSYTLTLGVNSFCNDFNSEMKKMSTKSNEPDNLDKKIDMISTRISDHMYGVIMKLSGKCANTLVVSPAINFATEKIGNLFTKRSTAIVPMNSQDLSTPDEISQAYKDLDLKPGASEKEINQKYAKLAYKYHPDGKRETAGKFVVNIGRICITHFNQSNS